MLQEGLQSARPEEPGLAQLKVLIALVRAMKVVKKKGRYTYTRYNEAKLIAASGSSKPVYRNDSPELKSTGRFWKINALRFSSDTDHKEQKSRGSDLILQKS